MITNPIQTEEIEDIELVSSCCYEMIVEMGSMKVCSSCEEICTSVYPPCPDGICDGSGEAPDYYLDSETHLMMLNGTKPCLHITF